MVRIDFNTFQLQNLVATGQITADEYDIFHDWWIGILHNEQVINIDHGAVWIDPGDQYYIDNPLTNPHATRNPDNLPAMNAQLLAEAIMTLIAEAGDEILQDIAVGDIPAYPRARGATFVGPRTPNGAFAAVFNQIAGAVAALAAAGQPGGPLAQLFNAGAINYARQIIREAGPFDSRHNTVWTFPGINQGAGPAVLADCPGVDGSGPGGGAQTGARRRQMTRDWIPNPSRGLAGTGELPGYGHWSGCESHAFKRCIPMLTLDDLCPSPSQCEIQHQDVDAKCGAYLSTSGCSQCMDFHYPGTSCDINDWCAANACPAKNRSCNNTIIQHCPPQWWLDKNIATGVKGEAPQSCLVCAGRHQKMMRGGKCTHQDLVNYCTSPENTCVSESDMENQRTNDMYCGLYYNKNQCIGDEARNCCWRSEDAIQGSYCFAGSQHNERRHNGLCVDTPHTP